MRAAPYISQWVAIKAHVNSFSLPAVSLLTGYRVLCWREKEQCGQVDCQTANKTTEMNRSTPELITVQPVTQLLHFVSLLFIY